MTTGSSSTSESGSRPGPGPRPPGSTDGRTGTGTDGRTGTGISTFKGEARALRADRLGTTGLLLSVLAATAPSWWSPASCPPRSA